MLSYKEKFNWKKAIDLSVRCYKLTEYFPKAEICGITSEIRSCSASIPSNIAIAEGYGKKSEEKYIEFLNKALGSARELDTYLTIALKVELTKAIYVESVLLDVDEIQRLLIDAIEKAQPSIKRK